MISTPDSAVAQQPLPGTASAKINTDIRAEASVPKQMKAVVQDRYGDADRLQLRTIDVPTPAPDEVLIDVQAAGVDRGVWHLMVGKPYLVRAFGFGLIRPKQPVPGLDVSGRVVKTGDQVTEFNIGDEVFGVGTGTFAEFAVAKAAKLTHRPLEIDPCTAAAIPISGITALQALRDIGGIRPNDRVLVMGASGGVGTYAVQLARYFGAYVAGVASASKLDFVRSLGAHKVYDYRVVNALDGSEKYDLIIDIGGRNPVSALRDALTPTGTLVFVGGEDGDDLTGGLCRQVGASLWSFFTPQYMTMFIAEEKGELSRTLGELMAAGDLRTPVQQIYNLDDAPNALADLSAGRVQGKAVIRVRDFNLQGK